MAIFFGIVVGFIFLIVGGELLVRGASNLAAAVRIPPLVIGLTVVAFGTSAPELAVSLKSCYAGSTELAVGNSVGSNISNLLLILGVAAVACPLTVQKRLFHLDLPAMIGAALLLWIVGRDFVLDRVEGVAMLVILAGYFWVTIKQGRSESIVLTAEEEIATGEITINPNRAGWGAIAWNLLLFVVGLTLLVLGADWLVGACVTLAENLGLSKLLIGLTIVAIGTSLPELVTSLVASMKGQRELAVGNVVGSNILNILLVLGASSVVAPDGIVVDSQSIAFDIPVMTIMSLAAIPVFYSRLDITRGEGALMIVYYVAYLGYLIWHALTNPGETSSVLETVLFLAPLVPLVGWVVLIERWRPISSE